MPSSRMFVPPMTQDLWPVIRTRLRTATMAAILKGPDRVYVRGDLKIIGTGTDARAMEAELVPEGEEKEAWGRVVIVPVLPIRATFEQLLPNRLRFLVRSDFNDLKAPGYPLGRELELSQREAARQLMNWDGSTLVSTQIMLASRFTMDEPWQATPQRDQEAIAGTVYVSSSWWVDVASAAD